MPPGMRIRAWAYGLLASVAITTANQSLAGSATASANDQHSNWQLGLTMGYGLRSNPLLNGDDLDLIAVVDVAWYGDYVFFDNGDLGLTLADNHRFTLNSALRVNTERLFFENTNSSLVRLAGGPSGPFTPDPNIPPGTDGNGDDTPSTPAEETERVDIPKRDYAVEGGLELLTDGTWGYLQASAFHDVSKKHDGYELNVNVGRSGHWRRFTWNATAGLSYRSEELNQYYYGVEPDEASRVLPVYQANDGVNWHLSTLIRYYLSANMSLGLVLEYQGLSNAIYDSPFVAEDKVTTAYAGVKYSF